jgi:hypothetical protein
VDYKSEPLTIRDYAKHISAFGNQFGGWLFVGVAEGPNKNMKAGAFPGVPTADVAKILVQVREAVSAHVSPPVYFDHKVIDGPVSALGLPPERSIIVIGVPEGANPPYVHSSGRIYRRIADSSDPKAETDRAVLDSMWRKSDELRTRFREFILKPTERARSEDTYCYVYLLADLTLSLPEYDLDFAGFKEAMRTDKADAPSIPLDNIYPTQDGFIARQVCVNDPLNELVSLRWWRNGNVRLTIPVNYINVSPNDFVRDELLNRFLAAMGKQRKEYNRILSLDQWLVTMMTMTGRFLDLRDWLKSTDPIYGKILFSNTRSSTPFIGMESYLKTVEQYGIPVVQDSTAMFPTGPDVNTVKMLKDEDAKDCHFRPFGVVVPLIMNGLKSLGVIFDTTDIEQLGREFTVAMNRGANGP